ncbi:MAG: chemotaxis protein CheX [Bacteriovoracaceae bacterium]|nr:chemotaxis protein CheX [Bacteriovoracaceae bacterium]
MKEISFQSKGSHGLFTFSERISLNDEEILVSVFNKASNSECHFFILDFKGTESMIPKFFRLFTKFSKETAQKMATINMNKSMQKEIIDAGVDNVFNFKSSYAEALTDFGIVTGKSPKLDVNFINPFIQATINTFGVQANTKIKLGKLFVKDPRIDLPMDIAGIIGITSKKFNGTLAICFPADIFLKIYSNMIGMEHTKIDQDIEDAAGEFTNIILGQAKSQLNDNSDYQIQKAIPSVFRGEGITLNHVAASASVVVPFQIEEGEFYLDICLDPA